MIVTVTPNPSLDRTAHVDRPIERGAVLRLTGVTDVAAGKGVNIARALHGAGAGCVAVVPAGAHDPFLSGLADSGIPFRAVETGLPVRTNLTVTEPDGTTTKFNVPGAELSAAARAELEELVVDTAGAASWVVFAGSLPPGLPTDWYARMVERIAATGVRIAMDTSDAPLVAAAACWPRAAPALIKPNSFELAQLAGGDGGAIEAAALAGDHEPALNAARAALALGVGEVLLTLGPAGALLVRTDGAWHARTEPVRVASTVGAGDSSLAGFLLAREAGADPATCVSTAVRWGSAAAALPGSTLPTPQQAAALAVTVNSL